MDRAKVHGQCIVPCAFSMSVSPDMLSTAPLFPPEAEFGVRLAEHGDVDVPVQQAPAEDDAGTADALERFVMEMDRLDFVGYNMLVNQWMLDWGIA